MLVNGVTLAATTAPLLLQHDMGELRHDVDSIQHFHQSVHSATTHPSGQAEGYTSSGSGSGSGSGVPPAAASVSPSAAAHMLALLENFPQLVRSVCCCAVVCAFIEASCSTAHCDPHEQLSLADRLAVKPVSLSATDEVKHICSLSLSLVLNNCLLQMRVDDMQRETALRLDMISK
jgi:hypothetical protein